jgi:ankyrin repeat protein
VTLNTHNLIFDYRNNCVILGVNVNIQDNAGWTPMHEACNHGSTQCVKELLHFVPAKTVEYYFSKGAYQYCHTSTKIDKEMQKLRIVCFFM